jgi:Nucleotidyl transferase AbiEii toxin, Type IV TA system
VSLDLAELQSVAAQFGVSDEQVHRDHVVSHLLALISGELADEILFIGGTALARAHLPDGRLSEDLDLIALARRSEVAAALDKLLPRGASRAVGALRWNPSLAEVRDADPAILEGLHGVRLKVQLLRSEGYASWPTERRALHQRYADAPG